MLRLAFTLQEAEDKLMALTRVSGSEGAEGGPSRSDDGTPQTRDGSNAAGTPNQYSSPQLDQHKVR